MSDNDQKIENIEFRGFNLECLKHRLYEESGAVIITFRTNLTPEEHQKIKEEWSRKDYFPVKIHSNQYLSLDMRLGNPTWSKHEDYFKYSITLVEKKYDEQDHRPIGLPDERNQKELVINTSSKLDFLIELLVDKGVLSDDKIQGIEEEIKERKLDYSYMMRKVEDLDEHEKHYKVYE